MVVDPRWPITRFGVDLTRAVPAAILSVEGNRVNRPSLMPLPFDVDTTITPVVVTGDTYVVNPGEIFIVIERDNPVATAIQLPTLAAAGNTPIVILDWSTNVNEHTITVTPGDGVIMRQANWQMVSNIVQLTRAMFTPVVALSGWMV